MLTILSDTTTFDDIALWHVLTKTDGTVLWDEGNVVSDAYQLINDNPEFAVIDRERVIRYRGYNPDGYGAAVETIEGMLAAEGR